MSIEILHVNATQHWELDESNSVNTATESFQIQSINTALSFAEGYKGSGLL